VRVAALYDIHGNLPALEAVLREVRRERADRVVVGGDVVPGPMPRETLACLQALDIPVQYIRGNGDREVLARMAGTVTDWYRAAPDPWREPVRWTAEQLRPEHEGLLRGWPETVRVEVPPLGEVLFCHATPRSDTETFTRLTPEARLVPLFDAPRVPLVVCGHTHMPFDRTVGAVRVVNAGSVGMPFGEPGADWLLLGPDVQPRHTPYDLAEAAERVRATTYPGGDDFAARNILRPPSEQEMLEAFRRVELR
jgi:predicted phosphodiesterase